MNVAGRQLMCVCRGCYLLFTDSDASCAIAPCRTATSRCRASTVDRRAWEALQIPVGLAFFFRNSALGRFVAFYPGPAGASESELDLQALDGLTAGDARLASWPTMWRRCWSGCPIPVAPECYLVPIDACYEFVGGLRMRWRGFDGGQQAREFIEGFFAADRRAQPQRCRP